MRHRKRTFKVGSDASHRRCMMANLLKSLVINERIETTITKARELSRQADKLITLAKENSLASKRLAIALLMVRYNSLDSKEARLAKAGKTAAYNDDRNVINKLFTDLRQRFVDREGGYSRVIQLRTRIGDDAKICLVEFLT